MGLIAFMISRDVALTNRRLLEKQQVMGSLSIVATESPQVEAGAAWSLREVTSIGRGAGNHIILKDEFASAEHLLINRRGPQWWVEDLNSSNGSWLNGSRLIYPTVITSGDIIKIGSTAIRFELEQPGNGRQAGPKKLSTDTAMFKASDV